MPNNLDNFRTWLFDKRRFRVAWFAKDPQTKPPPDEALSQLPEDISSSLVAEINDLPSHPHIKETVSEAIGKAMKRWRADPYASNNSIVVLGNPVSSVSRILTDALHDMQREQADKFPVRLLDWVDRPADIKTIKQQVQDKLNLDEDQAVYDKTTDQEDKDREKTLMLIPNLCWCFLRSADGLDGLDYLQDLLPRDRHQFWVLGSGIVGWEYLSSTIKFHAYCGETIDFPSLSGEQLQEWLAPVVEKFDIHFLDSALHKRLQEPDSLLNVDIDIENPVDTLSDIGQEVNATVQSSVRAIKESVAQDSNSENQTSPELDYFNRLADISEGNSVVALQLFVRSLRYRVFETEEGVSEQQASNETSSDSDTQDYSKKDQGDKSLKKGSDRTEEAESDGKQLVATIPKQPPLPELSQSDLYLLYSLLLHGDMTVRALANSLGDAPHVVNNQVQILRRKGVIEQRGKVLKTNPVHYPRLRKELSNNNFIISL